MPYLTRTLQDWLKSGHKKADLCKDTGLSAGYMTDLFKGQIPKPDTFSRILAAISDPEARSFLRSYLMDVTPEEWRARVEIQITEPLDALQEELPDDPAKQREMIMTWLTRETEHNESLFTVIRAIWEMNHGTKPRPPKI